MWEVRTNASICEDTCAVAAPLRSRRALTYVLLVSPVPLLLGRGAGSLSCRCGLTLCRARRLLLGQDRQCGHAQVRGLHSALHRARLVHVAGIGPRVACA